MERVREREREREQWSLGSIVLEEKNRAICFSHCDFLFFLREPHGRRSKACHRSAQGGVCESHDLGLGPR